MPSWSSVPSLKLTGLTIRDVLHLRLLSDLPCMPGLICPFSHAAVEVEKNVTVPISTDKGLCGGINSTVSKYARGTLRAFEGGVPPRSQYEATELCLPTACMFCCVLLSALLEPLHCPVPGLRLMSIVLVDSEECCACWVAQRARRAIWW